MALVSDAGTPTVADPGADLAAACASEGIAVVPVPGPSAPAAALVAAGLPTDVYTFIGFLPPKPGRALNPKPFTLKAVTSMAQYLHLEPQTLAPSILYPEP